MTRRPRPVTRGDDEGVSVVIGAILLTAIVLGSIVMVQLTYVPIWEQDNEAKQAVAAMDGMAKLNGDIATSLQNGTKTTLSSSVDLQRESNNPLAGSTFPQRLVFTPGDHQQSGFSLASRNLLQQSVNGTTLAGVNESWNAVSGTQLIEDAVDVLNFRLNITDADPDDGDQLVVKIIDAKGKEAGTLTAYFEEDPPDLNLHIRVRAPTDPPTTLYDNRILSVHQTNWQPGYYIDLLNSEYRFDRLLDAARTPYDVHLIEDPTEGEFTVTYVKDEGGNSLIVGGGGVAVQDFTRNLRPGSLAYESDNAHYPNQDILLENGAIILSQRDGNVFRVNPPVSVADVGGTTKMTINLPVLTGDSTTLTGSPSAVVQTIATKSERLVGIAGTLNVTIPTQFPGLWADHLEKKFKAAGLDPVLREPNAPTCDLKDDPDCYQVHIFEDAAADRVVLSVAGRNGHGAGPDNPIYDVSVTLVTAHVNVEVRT